MTPLLHSVSPQPLTDIFLHLKQTVKAKGLDQAEERLKTARVCAYAFSRLALAGMIYYGMNRYGANAIQTTIGGALISTPATVLFWSGKHLVSGGKTLLANYRTPFTLNFAAGFFQMVVASKCTNFYAGPPFTGWGLVERFIFPKFLPPGLLTSNTKTEQPF